MPHAKIVPQQKSACCAAARQLTTERKASSWRPLIRFSYFLLQVLASFSRSVELARRSQAWQEMLNVVRQMIDCSRAMLDKVSLRLRHAWSTVVYLPNRRRLSLIALHPAHACYLFL